MPRGTQLQDLIYQLRAEVGQSTLVSVGIDNVPALIQILRRKQIMLYDDYDWPFLRITPFINLKKGERFYDMPDDFGALNMERIEHMEVWYSGRPSKIERGIGPADYAQYNSFNGETGGGPIIKWDIKYTDPTGTDVAKEQVEVWPIPDDDGQKLQLTGIKNLRPLVALSDQAELDDVMIVLHCAAQILKRQKAADAPDKQKDADDRTATLKGRVKGAERTYIMGGGPREESLRGKTIIRVSGSGTQS